MMRLSTLALLMCCLLFACDDKDTSKPGPDAGTAGAAGDAGSGGEAGSGGAAGAGGEAGSGGAAGAGGEAGESPEPDCVDFSIFQTCDEDESVRECWSNSSSCTESDSPLGTTCDTDDDCDRGSCINDAVCNEAHATCVEDAGFPDAADCLRLFESCLAERGESAVGDCGALVNECTASLTACE
ncbi:MAG: hypothetical protein ACPGQS_11240 [Bradymonadia bacterium]